MIRHTQSPGIVRTFHSSIFRGIDAYSATLTGAKLKGKGEAFPALFENRKRVLILERKVVIVSTFGLNFPFKIKF